MILLQRLQRPIGGPRSNAIMAVVIAACARRRAFGWVLLLAFALVTLLMMGCGSTPSAQADAEPLRDTPQVRETARAIVTVPPGRGLPDSFCVRLYDLKSTAGQCDLPGADPLGVVYATSFRQGQSVAKLAISAAAAGMVRFTVASTDRDTRRDTRLASWAQVHPREEIYRKTLSVSPDGRRVALVRNAAWLDGGADAMVQGPLELLDLDTREWRSVGVNVLDAHPVQWVSESQVIVVRAIARDRLPLAGAELADGSGVAGGSPADGFGASYARAEWVPVVSRIDLVSGAVTLLHVGRRAIVSTDGSRLIVQDGEGRLRLVNLSGPTLTSSPLPRPPGFRHRGVIGFAGPAHVLYWAVTAPGLESERTVSNSPLAGPKPVLSLRVATLKPDGSPAWTGESAIAVLRIDPRSSPAVDAIR